MIITWHGQYTIKLTNSHNTIVIDPYAPSCGLPPFRCKADIVALTFPADPSMSHTDGIQGNPIIINTAGEYSFNDTTLYARGWLDQENKVHSLQRWHIEDLAIMHLGQINRLLTNDELSEIEKLSIDILIVPIGGGHSLSASQAIEIITTIEPRLVIPIHYHLPHLKEKLETLDDFTKAMGLEKIVRQPKLSITRRKLPSEGPEVVLLKP